MVNPRVDIGAPLYLWEGTQVGVVKEVRGAYLKVDAPLVPDYWLAIDQVGERNGRLELTSAFVHYVTPPEPETDAGDQKPDDVITAFQRILLPLDGSAFSEQALGYAVEMARRYDAQLVLLRAVDGPRQLGAQLGRIAPTVGAFAFDPGLNEQLASTGQEADADAHAYLSSHQQRLEEAGVAVSVRAIDADPVAAILAEATREPGTAVVMTTRGRGGLGRLIFGSTANAVVLQCRVPVLLIRVADGATAPTPPEERQRDDAEPAVGEEAGRPT